MDQPEPLQGAKRAWRRAGLAAGGIIALAALALTALPSRIPQPLRIAPPAPSANSVRPAPIRLPATPGHFLPFVCEPAFGEHKFWDPLFVAPLGEDRTTLLVVERSGTVQAIRRNDQGDFSRSAFLNLESQTVLTAFRAGEGLLGLALHPEFSRQTSPHRGEVFAFYVGRSEQGLVCRLSRFRTFPGQLDRVDPATEEILIDQLDHHQAHNAGSLAFGPDGFLYVAVGDDANDGPNSHAQQIGRDLFSGVLRIDVDRRGGTISHAPPRQPATGKTAGYLIPSDNPFVGEPDALEEFYAIGLRNPWRMSFDRKSGKLYVSDPGDKSREEINLVEKGSNCGWGDWEGTLENRTAPASSARRGIPTPPLFEYTRDFAHRCVIGGYVYRGPSFPELQGQYVYADQSGRIYALELLDEGTRAGENRLIAMLPEPGIGISSLGEDVDGELYFCLIGKLASETGSVYRLRKTAPTERDAMPPTLADTGLFLDESASTPHPRLTPFEVNTPLWSDGADKRRWIAPPPDKQVTLKEDGQLDIPAGAVFVKHFALATDRRRPEQLRPLETRVLICSPGGDVFGASYRWSADGHETRIVNFNEEEVIECVDGQGRPAQQTWMYPGRFECLLCHNDASGHILGFSLKQLDRDVPCPGGESLHQFEVLSLNGVISPADAALARSTPRQPLAPLHDATASLEDRVRSYLHVNCSVCHNPERQFAAFDARFLHPIPYTGIVNGPAYHAGPPGPNTRIIRPGDLEHSMIYLRMSSSVPESRMPPLGSTVVDAQAAAVIAEWIQSLPPDRTAAPPVTHVEEVRDNFRR
ncbi:PQQ-dependent sugar dehydrogenase [Planctellipticum variicoloris]|uniref:PQQ-dependent sugar dehydrogenase n=1 Tax=Planctellipticum variicoloris TaxID=3064265 RepID=UPI003013D26D|nr:PQQ-dependent sugar dehydrogenase [Planctomycetaceae bacterium SH412]